MYDGQGRDEASSSQLLFPGQPSVDPGSQLLAPVLGVHRVLGAEEAQLVHDGGHFKLLHNDFPGQKHLHCAVSDIFSCEGKQRDCCHVHIVILEIRFQRNYQA